LDEWRGICVNDKCKASAGGLARGEKSRGPVLYFWQFHALYLQMHWRNMQPYCQKHWYAVHTKPHQEHTVQDVLVNRGIETYLPVLKPSRIRPPREAHPKPFFPSYLFACLDLTRVPMSSINWTPGVNRLVSFGGQPALVAAEVLHWLKHRLAQIDERDYHHGLPLQPGDRLRLVKGPLKDVEAIFEQRLSSPQRVRVLIEILGRLTPCQINLQDLERIEA
jgi:transcriptional antiterminator RfaH